MPPKKNRKFSQHKNRVFSAPEDIQAQMEKLDVEDSSKEETSSEEETSSSGDESSSDDSQPKRGKGVSDLIQIENPNRNPPKLNPNEKVQLSRREREEIEKQREKERHNKLPAEGKTDQAKADMARLAEIRKRREEEAAKRAAAAAAKPTTAKK